MFVSPIVERELRIALRKHRAVKSRFRMAASAAAVVCLFLLFGRVFGLASWGPQLHVILFFWGLYLAVIPPAQFCVGLFCEERRNQTLELLYLTGLGPGELFFGKLFGGVLIASSELLALTPFLAVPFLSGGVSIDLFLATVGCFPVLLLFTVAVGVLASVMSRDDGAALAFAIILAAVICLASPLPYFLGKSVSGAAPFSTKWLCLSPAYAPYLVGTKFSGAKPHDFWLTAGVTLLWAFAILCAASLLLNRNWRSEILRDVPTAGWRFHWNAWVHGSATWRRELRDRLLPKNPFQWLAQQDRQPVLAAWLFIGGIIFVWLLGWATWPHVWASPTNLFFTALLMIVGTSYLMIYAAGRRIGIERREGSLELLLTTPLKPMEIVAGQKAALEAQFQPVRKALLGLFALMAVGGLFLRHWTPNAVYSYLAIWFCLFVWGCFRQTQSVPRSMWLAFNTGRPLSAVFHIQRKGWWWIYLLINFRNISMGLKSAVGFPTGSIFEMIFVSLFGVIFIIMAFSTKYAPLYTAMSERLIGEMRFIARQPLPDPNDKRFKKWLNASMTIADYVKSYPERMEHKWGYRLGGHMGRQLGKGWAHLRRRRRS